MARYWWFQGASVEELTRQLNALGSDAVLEVRPQGDSITLHVVPAGAVTDAAGEGGINDAHPCPPLCR